MPLPPVVFKPFPCCCVNRGYRHDRKRPSKRPTCYPTPSLRHRFRSSLLPSGLSVGAVATNGRAPSFLLACSMPWTRAAPTRRRGFTRDSISGPAMANACASAWPASAPFTCVGSTGWHGWAPSGVAGATGPTMTLCRWPCAWATALSCGGRSRRRAAGVDCSVHEVSLSVAMRGSSCEALCALDVTGVAPFASWSLLLLAVINPCVGIQGVRHIAARGGPYGVDVLERAARGGRIGVLEYLPDDDGPATAAEAVVVAHNFGRRADAPDGGWRREAAARVLGWLRSQSFGCCGHGLVRRQQQRWQAFVALTGRPLPFPSCGASPNCRKIQPASGT